MDPLGDILIEVGGHYPEVGASSRCVVMGVSSLVVRSAPVHDVGRFGRIADV